MPFHLTMPMVGETMEKGTILRWLKPEGTWIQQGEPLVEIETEKVTLEIQAPRSGRLKIVAPEESELPPGGTMAYLLAAGEEAPAGRGSIPSESSVKGGGQPISPPEISGFSQPSRGRISPVARKLATDKGIDIEKVTGTGPGGRIVERDVIDWIEKSGPVGSEKIISAQTRASRQAVGTLGLSVQSVPYKGLRKTVGERMHKSLSEMAQLTIGTKVDVSSLDDLRNKIIAAGSDSSPRVTYTDFVVKAVAIALQQHPGMNARLASDSVELISEVNVGLAIALKDGLVVGVIQDPIHLSLADLAQERIRLSEAAREGRLDIADVSGGTFTVTTLGAWGIDVFTPIVNPPEAGILGVGVVEDVLRPVDGQPSVRKQMHLSLSFDHRILDGVPAARFLSQVRELLERPYVLVV